MTTQLSNPLWGKNKFSVSCETRDSLLMRHDPSLHGIEFRKTADGNGLERVTNTIPNLESDISFENDELTAAARRAAEEYLKRKKL